MGNSSEKHRKSLTGQKTRQYRANKWYTPVAKHSQKKEHPNTFVVGIRLPYKYYQTYSNLSAKQREGLREVISGYFNSLAE